MKVDKSTLFFINGTFMKLIILDKIVLNIKIHLTFDASCAFGEVKSMLSRTCNLGQSRGTIGTQIALKFWTQIYNMEIQNIREEAVKVLKENCH